MIPVDGGPDPGIALVSQLDDCDGLDLVEAVLTRLVGLGLQLAVLGAGDHRYQALLRRAVLRHPGRVGVHIGFDGERAPISPRSRHGPDPRPTGAGRWKGDGRYAAPSRSCVPPAASLTS